MPAIDQYLERHAEPEVLQLQGFSGHFQQGLIIPVYRETTAILERFSAFAAANPATLLVLVLNRPESDSDSAWCQHFFARPQPPQWQSSNAQLQLHALANQSGLLLVDRCLRHPAIPDKQGVGLARKIGADILCSLIASKRIISPWIFNTDADAHLPAAYFGAVTDLPKHTAGAIYPFEHSFDNLQLDPLPTLLYEFSLHYYVAGLRWAGSPYAYQTLGSIIAIHYQAYARVRGFPKRCGAEDFYLLNKAAKTGAIITLEKPLITIEARESSRVPFGTGPAVKALSAMAQPLAMPVYHPECFLYLKVFLVALEYSAATGKWILPASSNSDAQSLDHQLLQAIASKMGIEQALVHANRQGKDQPGRQRHLQQWFDGFKTLKLIHQLRDSKLARIRFDELSTEPASSPYREFITPAMQTLLRKIAGAA